MEVLTMARIYIAEDDSDIRQIISFCFLDDGHEVSALKDGEAAWEQLLSHTPDLLILDLMMPGMDGLEILASMNSWGIRDATRVVVVTAKASDAVQDEVRNAGADRMITKPFDPDRLTEIAKEVLATPLEDLAIEREARRDKTDLLSQLETLLGDA
jgi:CheY-like chemotaxis protein